MCRQVGFFFGGSPNLARHAPFEKALAKDSRSIGKISGLHEDGWTVEWFGGSKGSKVGGRRSVLSAWSDPSYGPTVKALGQEAREGQVVAGLAHVRHATVGVVEPQNVHGWKKWGYLSSMNGSVPGYANPRKKARVLELIHPKLREELEGGTDSEALFALVLTYLRGRTSLLDRLQGKAFEGVAKDFNRPTADELGRAMKMGIEKFVEICGVDGERDGINLIVTNPYVFGASRYNRTLEMSLDLGPSAEYPLRTEGALGLAVASEAYGAGLNWTTVPQRVILTKDLNPGIVQTELDKKLLRMNRVDAQKRNNGLF